MILQTPGISRTHHVRESAILSIVSLASMRSLQDLLPALRVRSDDRSCSLLSVIQLLALAFLFTA